MKRLVDRSICRRAYIGAHCHGYVLIVFLSLLLTTGVFAQSVQQFADTYNASKDKAFDILQPMFEGLVVDFYLHYRLKGDSERAKYVLNLEPNVREIIDRGSVALGADPSASMLSVVRGYLIDATSAKERELHPYKESVMGRDRARLALLRADSVTQNLKIVMIDSGRPLDPARTKTLTTEVESAWDDLTAKLIDGYRSKTNSGGQPKTSSQVAVDTGKANAVDNLWGHYDEKLVAQSIASISTGSVLDVQGGIARYLRTQLPN